MKEEEEGGGGGGGREGRGREEEDGDDDDNNSKEKNGSKAQHEKYRAGPDRCKALACGKVQGCLVFVVVYGYAEPTTRQQQAEAFFVGKGGLQE